MKATRYVLPPLFAGRVTMLQAQAREPSYDVILRGGTVVDGTRAERVKAGEAAAASRVNRRISTRSPAAPGIPR